MEKVTENRRTTTYKMLTLVCGRAKWEEGGGKKLGLTMGLRKFP